MLLFFSSQASGGSSQILLCPFIVHSKEDLSFLSKGIEELLSARMKSTDNLVPVRLSDQVLRNTSLDYILTGSITFAGETVSTTAQLIAADTGLPAYEFQETGAGEGAVLIHAGHIADGIHKAFSVADTGKDETEKIPEDGSVLLSEVDTIILHPVWESSNMDLVIQGMAIGDADGDGKNEIVCIDDRKVYLYRLTETDLERIGIFRPKGQITLTGVDIADLDGNGRGEVFVTAVNKHGKVASFILEWLKGEFSMRAEGLELYFRGLHIPGKSDCIMAQRPGMPDTGDGFGFSETGGLFSADIFRFGWEKDGYDPVFPNLPAGIDLYGLYVGPVDDTGKPCVVQTSDGSVRLMDAEGSLLWEDDTGYGRSERYLETSGSGRYFLPQRVIVIGDEASRKILLVRNSGVMPLFSRYRRFSSGSIDGWGFSGSGMKKKWTTGMITGYVSDVFSGDGNNDGRREIAAVVVKAGSFMSGRESRIVLFDFPEKKGPP